MLVYRWAFILGACIRDFTVYEEGHMWTELAEFFLPSGTVAGKHGVESHPSTKFVGILKLNTWPNSSTGVIVIQ